MDTDPELGFEGFEARDAHRVLLRAVERDITVDVEMWFEENEGDPGYQKLSAD